MGMALTRLQRRRLYHVLAVGKQKGASRGQLLSAIVTHRTESNYGNPAGGDGTSSGWRQQITGAGVKSRNRRNIRQQAGYYFDEARGQSGTPGQISHAVQRSAYPGRASDPGVNREAVRILSAFERGQLGKVPRRGGSRRGSAGTPGTPGSPATVSREAVEPGGTGLAGLLAARQQARPLPQSPLPTPAHSASAPLPKGFQDLSSSGGGDPPAVSVDEQLAAVAGLGGQGVPRSTVNPGTPATPGSAPSRGGGALPGGGGKGKLVGRPSDRAGVPTSKKLLGIVRRGSALGGIPIQLGTGSNHDQMTRSGNVSDHWTGHGIDLPARGKQGDRIAGAILMALGVPRKRARRMAQRGTGYGRINGYQVLWKTDSDHQDHVHVGGRGR